MHLKLDLSRIAALLLAGACAALSVPRCGVASAAGESSDIVSSGHWRTLKPTYLLGRDDSAYVSFPLAGNVKAYLLVVDTRRPDWSVRPALAQPTTAATSAIALREHAIAAINGGYFNLKGGGQSTSYVTIDGKLVADPTTNSLLMGNPKLKNFLPAILDRSEIRVLQDQYGQKKIAIERHSAPIPKGLTLVHALQAGPRLLPEINARQEAFVRSGPDGEVDSIGTCKPAARTAFGITKDGYALLLTVAGVGQDPESKGITLSQLSELMRKLGCSEAINLDGGASTTMFVDKVRGVVCGKSPPTLVKSALIVESRQ